MRRIGALPLLLFVCGPAFRASAAITFSQDETYASVSDNASNDTADFYNTGGTTASAQVSIFTSTTTSQFNSAVLSGNFDQTRPGNLYSYSYGAISAYFSSDADVSYTATGSYSNLDGYTVYYGYLYDFMDSAYLFYSNQQGNGGAAAYTLGGAAGNLFNDFQGSLTGTLLAGHSYSLYAQAYTQAYFGADGGAAAGGNFSVTLGDTAVPEFSSAIVWSLLALTIGGACWWKRAPIR